MPRGRCVKRISDFDVTGIDMKGERTEAAGMKEWYRCTVKEVLEGLKIDGIVESYLVQGLSGEQVRKRQSQYGENRLRESGRKPAWKVFFEQFQDLLVMILIGAAVISMLTDNVESTVVIFAVILMNAVLGTVQHQRAEKSLESLRALSAPSARVLRDGGRREIPSAEVVPGDILCLEAGDLVTADGRIFDCTALKVNESSLTGESDAVEKSTEPVGRRAGGARPGGRLRTERSCELAKAVKSGEAARTSGTGEQPEEGGVPLAERTCMVYSGSLVTAGVGSVIVTATGMDTEIGGIASLMDHAKEKRTPLQISLDRFSSRLAAAIMVVCLVVFFLGIYRGMSLLDSLLFAVALAVAAVPEALGSIVTIVQAMGTQKMAKEQAIIKDLKAVESLGCVSVICTDKTGTLTQNHMRVEQVVIGGKMIPAAELNPADERQRFFLEACVLANNAELAEGAEAAGRNSAERPDLSGENMTERRGAAAHKSSAWAGMVVRDAAGRSEPERSAAPAQGVGDATELALLELVQSCGLSPKQIRRRYPRISEIPFDSERKMMSAVHRFEGRRLLLCKGAADVLLGRCSLTLSERKYWLEQMDACSERGLRVLGVAYRFLDAERTETERIKAAGIERTSERGLGRSTETGGAMENGMTFLGMAAMMDPPRPESAEAVADAKRAGIRTIMITGDHKVTAAAVARQIGILGPEVAGRAELPKSGTHKRPAEISEEDKYMYGNAGIYNRPDRSAAPCAVTGAELDAMSDRELSARLDQISVYARVTPQHKLRIVRAWQNRGCIVAMTGDGVNDAPALKQADIGVAMGRGGTEVSKDAADMILADDNFATIIKAVANGRNVYRNILGAIQFLLSGNMAGILCILYTTLLALPLPFAPVHLLFINLLTDSLPALAIGMEPPEKGLLDGPPRDPKRGILTAGFIRDVLLQGGLIAVCTLCAYRLGLSGTLAGDPTIVGSLAAAGDSVMASTMAFATLTLARLFHGFNCRSRRSLFRLGLFSNSYTVLAFLAGTILLAAVLLVPGMQIMFAAADLSQEQLICVGFLAVLPTLAIQGWRLAKGVCRCLTRKDRRFI